MRRARIEPTTIVAKVVGSIRDGRRPPGAMKTSSSACWYLEAHEERDARANDAAPGYVPDAGWEPKRLQEGQRMNSRGRVAPNLRFLCPVLLAASAVGCAARAPRMACGGCQEKAVLLGEPVTFSAGWGARCEELSLSKPRGEVTPTTRPCREDPVEVAIMCDAPCDVRRHERGWFEIVPRQLGPFSYRAVVTNARTRETAPFQSPVVPVRLLDAIEIRCVLVDGPSVRRGCDGLVLDAAQKAPFVYLVGKVDGRSVWIDQARVNGRDVQARPETVDPMSVHSLPWAAVLPEQVSKREGGQDRLAPGRHTLVVEHLGTTAEATIEVRPAGGP